MESSGSNPLLGPSRRVKVVLGVLLVAATLLVYSQLANHEFIVGWDDDVYITANPHVNSGFTVANVRWAMTSLEPFYWHPLTWLSHMLDVQLFGLSSGAHHFENAVLHALNALLLFWLLYRATGALGRSFFAAGLFALHPLNVETVAWAAERKSILSLFFSLVTIAVYGWYVRNRGWRRYLVVTAGFLLALMCKPAAVTLPVVLLFLDYWPLQRDEQKSSRRWLLLGLEKVPLLLIGVAVSVITVLGERAGGTMVPFSVLPLYTRVENAVISYVLYLVHALWPAKLSVFYPHPASIVGPSLPLDQVLASAIILAGITALVIHLRRQRSLAFGWSLFLFTMLPMIGIIQVGYQGLQDHFAYVPAIGLFIALAWGLGDAVERMSLKTVVPAVASLALLVALGAATNHYVGFWKNGVQLFGHARASAGRPNPWLEQLYANALLSAGNVDEAFQHYQTSCTLGPRNEHCHFRLGEILYERGQYRGAIAEYQAALMFTRDREIALTSLTKSGTAFLQMGQYEAAQQALTEALKVDSTDPRTLELRQRLFTSPGSR